MQTDHDPDFLYPIGPGDVEAAASVTSLAKLIREANTAYYVLDEPVMSDHDYDELCRELQDLLSANPRLVLKDNPLLKVGADVGGTVRHITPMLSLANVLGREVEVEGEVRVDYSELARWLQLRNYSSYIVEPKYDGLALSIVFDAHGVLHAATRGDCQIGEDVTAAVVSSRIAAGVSASGYHHVEVRGEVLVEKRDMHDINVVRVANGNKPFTSPRHAASGILRSKSEGSDGLRSFLRFIPYEVIVEDGGELRRVYHFNDAIHTLETEGETFVDQFQSTLASSPAEVMEIVSKIAVMREDMRFEIDGLVIKITDPKAPEELGSTSKHPNWMVAYKFPAARRVTTITGYRLQVGRTGVITPVADVLPVVIGGVEITSPTLNNFAWIHERKLEVGVDVLVERAADVIPAIVKRVTPVDDHYVPMPIPTRCPCCGSMLVCSEDHRHLRCVNNMGCSAQVVNAIAHFASRPNMNIKDLGPSMISDLVESDMVKSPADLYRLTVQNIVEACSLPKGSSLASKVWSNIQKSLVVNPAKLLSGMGIAEVGTATARELIEHFGSIQRVWTASTEEFVGVAGIAKTKALTISASMFAMQPVYEQLMMLPWQFITETKVVTGDAHAGQVWCITGKFPKPRKDIEAYLTQQGATTTDKVNSKTTHVLAGEKATSHKVKSALALNLKVWSWEDFQA